MKSQSYFFFGQRYHEGDRVMMPLAVKLHHACTAPLMLNELLTDFANRFPADAPQSAVQGPIPLT